MGMSTASVPLEFLLVSGDHSNLNTVKTGLGSIGANLGCTTAQEARDYVDHHKVDGIILDLEVGRAVDFITSVRFGAANRRAFIFACVGGNTESAAALKGGANALLRKPVTPESIASGVKAFKGIIVCERRRSFRHPVTLPVHLTTPAANHRALMENISEGGMAVRLPKSLDTSSLVDFSFELPFAARITGSGKVVWANREGLMGVEFFGLQQIARKALLAWLRDRAPSA